MNRNRKVTLKMRTGKKKRFQRQGPYKKSFDKDRDQKRKMGSEKEK